MGRWCASPGQAGAVPGRCRSAAVARASALALPLDRSHPWRAVAVPIPGGDCPRWRAIGSKHNHALGEVPLLLGGCRWAGGPHSPGWCASFAWCAGGRRWGGRLAAGCALPPRSRFGRQTRTRTHARPPPMDQVGRVPGPGHKTEGDPYSHRGRLISDRMTLDPDTQHRGVFIGRLPSFDPDSRRGGRLVHRSWRFPIEPGDRSFCLIGDRTNPAATCCWRRPGYPPPPEGPGPSGPRWPAVAVTSWEDAAEISDPDAD